MLAAKNIKPLIETRSMWKGDPERVLEDAGIGNIVYDEAGTISCYDMVSEIPIRHEMAYIGHEAKRGTLKYRCPARHRGWACPCDGRCNQDRGYGLTVRVKQSLDLRRFPPIPRATKTFERLYSGSSANERVNARLKIFWGADGLTTWRRAPCAAACSGMASIPHAWSLVRAFCSTLQCLSRVTARMLSLYERWRIKYRDKMKQKVLTAQTAPICPCLIDREVCAIKKFNPFFFQWTFSERASNINGLIASQLF